MNTGQQSTTVLVRAQACGGKFLGANVHYSQITIRNAGTIIFQQTITAGDSGTVTPTFAAAKDSRGVIVVQPIPAAPPAGAYWLQSNGGITTAGVIATFPLAAPALLEFQATTVGTATPVTSSVMMWVIPGMQLTSEPGLVINIPGLNVAVAPVIFGNKLRVTGTVTMMCGCPITTPTWPEPSGGPEPYWPAPEFGVVAVVTPPNGSPVEQRMVFQSTNTYLALFPVPPSGKSIVAVYALQPAESNVGYAQATISV